MSSVKPVLELAKGKFVIPDRKDTTLPAKIKANVSRVLPEKYSPTENS